MSDAYVSLAVLGAAVLLSEAARAAAARLLSGAHRTRVLEAASTFQLCCCAHELKLLGAAAPPAAPLGLALTYVVTVVHLGTFRGATCSPIGAAESVCRGSSGAAAAAVLVACQFAAAVAARFFATAVWSLGLSEVHVRHQKFGFRCFDPLGGTLPEAAAVELGCAFAVQAAAMRARGLDEKLRAPFVAAVITAVVYAGGGISGAVFNPVLAFSVQFPCSGHSYAEYCLVYWLSPVLGVASCVLLFEKVVPFLSGKTPVGPDVPAVQKQKTQ
ncbi:aquaporin-11 [Pungitius pungitius]|uniref:aquaporin-11 n=1 Tax=Pungitius pungitius TaxID=134920 RepID=UPI0018884982|nr:aquaporin-11 [Pungitius pungitius]